MLVALRIVALMTVLAPASAHCFDLQGHRGARGLAPENTLEGFAAAMRIGVSTLELDLAMTRDGVLVVSHDHRLNPDHTRGPDGAFLAGEGPAIRALTHDELQRYDVGRLRPGSRYAERFPEQKPTDGARIPALDDVFALARVAGADHVRFNIETKITPASGDETPPPEDFAAAVAKAIRDAGLTARASVQSFDWRTLVALKAIAPEIELACLTAEAPRFDTVQRANPSPSPWLAGFDLRAHGGSLPRMAKAAGCAVWSPLHRDLDVDGLADARRAGLRVIPWTVNDRAEMARLIAMGVDGIITDYPDRLRAVMAARSMALPPPVEAPSRRGD